MRIVPLLATSLIAIIMFMPASTGTNGWYSLQVGAVGDPRAEGSMGVRVEIQTNIYPIHKPDLSDSFWVATVLEDGGFIQFGYQIEPGDFCFQGLVISGINTCTGGSGVVGSSDARWFWQYWPDAHGMDYYYGKGSSDSVGPNGEWHTYAIVPDPKNGWDFALDGQKVGSVQAKWSYSSGSPYVIAEKLTYSNQPGNLGPVQFKHLQYFQAQKEGPARWKDDAGFTFMAGCGLGAQCISDPDYGIAENNLNVLVIGSGQGASPASAALSSLTNVGQAWTTLISLRNFRLLARKCKKTSNPVTQPRKCASEISSIWLSQRLVLFTAPTWACSANTCVLRSSSFFKLSPQISHLSSDPCILFPHLHRCSLSAS